MNVGHRKTVRHYDEPGHCHELTFSCYQRMPLLTNNLWREMLGTSIEHAAQRQGFWLVAFVFMPEHVHLLVYPISREARVHRLLRAIKQPFSYRIKVHLEAGRSSLLARLMVRERPGKTAFRFWQEGGGYDRNLTEPRTVAAAIDYIHLNPVRRRLVQEPKDWRWSSCRYYVSEGAEQDAALPRLHPLPAEFWEK